MSKISDLAALTALASGDLLVGVDISDTPPATGNTKKITAANLFGATTPVPYDLTFNSANGVNFGNDTLRFYVEGSWTPTVIGATSGEASYTTQSGRYTRIGRLVHVAFRIVFTKNTVSGDVRIGGLPLTNSNVGASRPGVAFSEIDEITFGGMLLGQVTPNQTYITLMDATTGAAIANLTDSDLHASNSMILCGDAMYFL